jgi:hypothetical protein
LDRSAIRYKYITMRSHEFVTESVAPGFSVYMARVKVKNPMYSTSVDVAVFAKSPAMARVLLQGQYGTDSIVSNVVKIA